MKKKKKKKGKISRLRLCLRNGWNKATESIKSMQQQIQISEILSHILKIAYFFSIKSKN